MPAQFHIIAIFFLAHTGALAAPASLDTRHPSIFEDHSYAQLISKRANGHGEGFSPMDGLFVVFGSLIACLLIYSVVMYGISLWQISGDPREVPED
jgi:hypothetical protein